METKKRLPNIIKVTILLAIVAVTFLIISITTSVLSVKRTENAINKIGDVTFNLETEEKIDLAISYYDKLDTNIGLDKNVKNINDLNEAKANYVRLALKKAIVLNNRKIADGITDEEITEAVNEGNLKLVKYFSEDEFETVVGYSEFQVLLEKYGTKEEAKADSGSSTSGEAEEPEIC